VSAGSDAVVRIAVTPAMSPMRDPAGVHECHCVPSLEDVGSAVPSIKPVIVFDGSSLWFFCLRPLCPNCAARLISSLLPARDFRRHGSPATTTAGAHLADGTLGYYPGRFPSTSVPSLYLASYRPLHVHRNGCRDAGGTCKTVCSTPGSSWSVTW